MIEICSNCGALLDAAPVESPEGGFDRVCAYCGARNHEAAAAPAPASSKATPKETPRAKSSKVGVVIVLGVVGCLIGFVVWGLIDDAYMRFTLDPDPDEDQPVVAMVAGHEAVAGRVRMVGNDDFYVDAFDGATQKAIWKLGPFGKYDGHGKPEFVLSGPYVVVVDPHATVHVYDSATGTPQRTVSLTDRVDATQGAVCAVPPSGAWMNQVDNKTILIDLATGKVTNAPKPKGCVSPWERETAADVEPTEPSLADFHAVTEILSGDTLVVFGAKSPGSPTPMVAGLDPSTHAPRWKTPLSAVDAETVRSFSFAKNYLHSIAACGDRVIGVYGAGSKAWHATAIGAKRGEREWDVKLKEIFAVDEIRGVRCTTGHVYVVREDSVDVLDAATGKALGTIGVEDYQ